MISSPPSETTSAIENLYEVLSSDRFLKMESIGNEVPLFIKPYPVEHESESVRAVTALSKRLQNKGMDVLKIDLLELVTDLLTEKGQLQRLLDREAGFKKELFHDTMRRLIDPQTSLVPAFKELFDASPRDITIIHGVGGVFPFVRTHNLLENLQPIVNDHPVVLFFPGDYRHHEGSGSALSLFGRLEHKGYYRAFNLDHYHL
ncbi:MAG: hypothetical protein ACJAVK_000309 [Akkermansiaceae bacterium]|jgi:hypothetical protein